MSLGIYLICHVIALQKWSLSFKSFGRLLGLIGISAVRNKDDGLEEIANGAAQSRPHIFSSAISQMNIS